MHEERDMIAQPTAPSAGGPAAEGEAELSEGEHGAAGPPAGPRTSKTAIDPEVPAKAKRRQFTAAYKLRILAEVDACTVPGGIGRILRREGLYSSHLSTWRDARDTGALNALSPRKRGRKPAERNPLTREVAELERKNARLEEELRKARIIIDVQKKVALLLSDNIEDPS